MGFPDEEPPSSTATRHSSPVIRLAATTPRTATPTAARCHPRRSVTTPSLPAHRQRVLRRRGPDIANGSDTLAMTQIRWQGTLTLDFAILGWRRQALLVIRSSRLDVPKSRLLPARCAIVPAGWVVPRP